MSRLAVAVAGAALSVGLAWNAGMNRHDTVVLTGVAAGGAVLTGIVGVLLLRALGDRPLRDQIIVVGLVTGAATVVGALGAADAMFVSAHDLDSLFVVLAAAATVGVLIALTLSRRIGIGARALEQLAVRIGDEATTAAVVSPRATGEELQNLARRLEESAARLEESRGRERSLEASRRELVAWVSHDLRTPLAGIRAMTEALEDGIVDDPDEIDRYHRTIRREAERLSELVDDLFELSRIQAAAVELSTERVSLTDVVSDAVATVTASARAKRVTVRGGVSGTATLVEASVPELVRVIRNLLDNAVRHTPPGGEVVVETGQDDGHAWIAVHDSCGGIPDDDLERVFDLAFRGDRARPPGEPGGGLGLAVARGLVEAHRGDIAVHNEGAGCRFTVRLPAATG